MITNHETIRTYEELTFNEWPAMKTVFLDGWILRISEGYTKRNNSVSPLALQGSQPLNHRIDRCEEIFYGHGLKPTFKMTPLSDDWGLDDELDRRGYKVVQRSWVMRVNLDTSPTENLHLIKPVKIVSDSWRKDFVTLSELTAEEAKKLDHILDLIAFPTLEVALKEENNTAAVGTGVLVGNRLGLCNIHTGKNYRGAGWGTKVVMQLLSFGRLAGAREAYLQVVQDNAPAVNLYKKFGFQELYSYWYRVKEQ